MDVLLVEPELGLLQLGCDPYVVTELQVGWPVVRSVMRNRALSDGAFDDTKYTGSRAVTLSVRLKNSLIPMQVLYDQVLPYLSPRRRPEIVWKLPGNDDWRSMIVRGENAPLLVSGPKFPALVCSWVCADGRIYASTSLGGGELCTMIQPHGDIETGRLYDENYADGGRGPYPASAGIGARLLENPGNAWADWRLTIFGAVTDPEWTVNGVSLRFDRNGGLDLLGGSSVVLDSRERTILLNGTPGDSRYDRTNYTEWTWDQLRLRPGQNEVRFGGAAITATATAEVCFRPAYLG